MKQFSQKHRAGVIVFFALIVALDQITKALAAANIPYGGEVRLIPGVVRLTYTLNDGAAFSMLGGMRWLFLVLVAAYFTIVGVLLHKRMITAPAELWALTAIGGGALGNAIDRAVSGKVVDMIEPVFMKFAVFNVADIFITCGAAVLVVYLLFFDRRGKRDAA